MNEDLAVADIARLRRARENGSDFVHQTVGHHDLDLDLGKEVHRVLAAPLELRMPLLPAEAANLRDRHADNAYASQGLLDVVELERLDDGLDLLHGNPPGAAGCAPVVPGDYISLATEKSRAWGVGLGGWLNRHLPIW